MRVTMHKTWDNRHLDLVAVMERDAAKVVAVMDANAGMVTASGTSRVAVRLMEFFREKAQRTECFPAKAMVSTNLL